MTTPDTRPTIAPQVGARYTLAQWLRDYAGDFCEEREAIMICAAADEIDKPRIEPPTVRQQFVMAAMEAMIGPLTRYRVNDDGTTLTSDGPGIIEHNPQSVAEIACVYADACMAEEERTRK